MKTVLQEFIEMVETCQHERPGELLNWYEIIEAAKQYLPAERKQIEHAYNSNGGWDDERDGAKYFNETYNG